MAEGDPTAHHHPKGLCGPTCNGVRLRRSFKCCPTRPLSRGNGFRKPWRILWSTCGTRAVCSGSRASNHHRHPVIPFLIQVSLRDNSLYETLSWLSHNLFGCWRKPDSANAWFARPGDTAPQRARAQWPLFLDQGLATVMG